MATADFMCNHCGTTIERSLVPGRDPGVRFAPHQRPDGTDCDRPLRRVWTAPHLGRMSSGEPPR